MPSRKIKIVDVNSGDVLREDYVQDKDKIFGLFDAADIVKSLFIVMCCASTVGGMWVNTNDHFKNVDDNNATVVKSLDEFKTVYWQGHKELMASISEQQDKQNARIDCLSGNLKGNCKDCQVC